MTNKVQIGTTDLHVNPIGFGTNAVGGHNLYPDTNDEAGKQLVKDAVDLGIDFFDTAYLYGPGRSEELIGESLIEIGKRSDVVIATKGAVSFEGQEMKTSNAPNFLKQNVEESLQRLQTDYIDLFYIHYPSNDTPKYEAVGALKELKEEGKIRAIGVSNFSIGELKEANQDGYVDVYQGEYNLINRAEEEDILPFTARNSISFVPYFPFAAGLLTGKYLEEPEFKDFRSYMPQFRGENFAGYKEKIEKLRDIAKTKQAEIAQVALAWYLTRDAIDTVIPGAKRKDQLESNLKANEVSLTDNEIKEIDEIFS